MKSSRLTVSGLTRYPGVLALGLSLAGSGFEATRPDIGGFLVHPILLLMLFYVSSIKIIRPTARGQALANLVIAFCMGFAFTNILGGGTMAFGFVLKLLVTITLGFIVSLRLRDTHEINAFLFAVTCAGAVVSSAGFFQEEVGLTGVNPMEALANKNAFSVLTLPTILCGTILLKDGRISRPIQITTLVTIAVSAVTIFSSANRSGWLGCFVIAGLLVWRTKHRKGVLRGVVVAVCLAGVLYVPRLQERSQVLNHRWQQSTEGYESDNLRRDLLIASHMVGITHPLLGVGAGHLSRNMTFWLKRPERYGPHNMPGFVAGSCGLLVYGMLILASIRYAKGCRSSSRESRIPLFMTVVLFWIRGLFTEEVLYGPAFGVLFGVMWAYHRTNRGMR